MSKSIIEFKGSSVFTIRKQDKSDVYTSGLFKNTYIVFYADIKISVGDIAIDFYQNKYLITDIQECNDYDVDKLVRKYYFKEI